MSLPDACLIYPGHDYRGLTVTSVREERAYNPRLGGDVDEADFTGYMNHLGLPDPRLMAHAMPANLRCGEPDSAAAGPTDPPWATLSCNFGGNWEIQPADLHERIGGAQAAAIEVLDVREPAEFDDALGHIRAVRLLPLSQLAARIDELPADRPLVAVCRSGVRSAQDTVLLQKAGRTEVANLAGGMLRWRSESLPVERASAATAATARTRHDRWCRRRRSAC